MSQDERRMNMQPRWDKSIVEAEIAELKRLLSVLPSDYEWQWFTEHIHRQIRAQIAVLESRWVAKSYKHDDADSAALWAMQWLYKSVPGMFDAMELRADQGPSEEWKMTERQLLDLGALESLTP